MQAESIESIPVAELVFTGHPLESIADARQTPQPEPGFRRSWVFRVFDAIGFLIHRLFGMASIIFCVAVVANVPILQLLGFGYLLEVSGRVSRSGRLSEGLVGIDKASRIGGMLLGTWLLLIPVRFFSDNIWYEAWLIDSTSPQTQTLRVVQIVLIALTVMHIVAAWICGGRLRYFFWPLIAPFSFSMWAIRRMLGMKVLRPILTACLDWISPNLTNDLCSAPPLRDWFVPMILWSKFRCGGMYASVRDGLWNFLSALNLWHYFRLGFKGMLGTAAWLALPTLLLIGATTLQSPSSLFAGVLGVLSAIPIFALLPFVQAHFARTGRLASFAEFRTVFASFRCAPLAHLAALLLTLLFALPLFLLKIESIPNELLWTLSIVFVLFAWPSRMAIALANRRGAGKSRLGSGWIAWPIMSLAIPISALFALILSLTRYISWNGAWSMIENHVFLLPAPFWL